MAFIKGDNRINRKGRQRGSVNHLNSVKKQLQKLLGEVLLEELKASNIKETLSNSSPATRLRFLSETMKFILPTASSDTDLDDIINELELLTDAKKSKN
tara:strand:- start:225 stop:521 length:297 start_codon:yes stop_codon:yes gene_type:complete